MTSWQVLWKQIIVTEWQVRVTLQTMAARLRPLSKLREASLETSACQASSYKVTNMVHFGDSSLVALGWLDMTPSSRGALCQTSISFGWMGKTFEQAMVDSMWTCLMWWEGALDNNGTMQLSTLIWMWCCLTFGQLTPGASYITLSANLSTRNFSGFAFMPNQIRAASLLHQAQPNWTMQSFSKSSPVMTTMPDERETQTLGQTKGLTVCLAWPRWLRAQVPAPSSKMLHWSLDTSPCNARDTQTLGNGVLKLCCWPYVPYSWSAVGEDMRIPVRARTRTHTHTRQTSHTCLALISILSFASPCREPNRNMQTQSIRSVMPQWFLRLILPRCWKEQHNFRWREHWESNADHAESLDTSIEKLRLCASTTIVSMNKQVSHIDETMWQRSNSDTTTGGHELLATWGDKLQLACK